MPNYHKPIHRKQLDKFYWHEALDRAHFIGEIVEEHLAKHPVIKADPTFKRMVTQVSDLLGQLYVEIGSNDPHWAANPPSTQP